MSIRFFNCTCTYSNIHLHAESSLTVNDDFNNEQIHIFIKIWISHFIFERVMFVACEKWEETRTDCYIDPKFVSRPEQHFFLILAGVAQPWVTEGHTALSLQAGSHAGILSPTVSNHPDTWLDYFLMPTFFRCSSAYLHRCISWLKALSRVNI